MNNTVRYRGRFLAFVETGDGYEYIKRVNAKGVVGVIAFTAEGELVLVEQFRPPVMGPVIGLPAGLVADEADEEPLQAARRELIEETGYWADELLPWWSGPLSSGSSAEIMQLFVAPRVQPRGAGGGVGDERIQVHRVAMVSLTSWLRKQQARGAAVDPKVLLALVASASL